MLRLTPILALTAASVTLAQTAATAAPFAVASVHRVSGPVRLADGCDPGPSENTPLVAVDPRDARHVAVTYAIGDGSASVLALSRDGGRHWRRAPIRGTVPCDGGGGAYASRFDPDLAFAPDGRLYVSESVQGTGSGTAGITTLAGTVAPRSHVLGPVSPITAADPLLGVQRGFLAFPGAGAGTADVLVGRIPYPGTYALTGTSLELASTSDGGASWTAHTILRQGGAGAADALNPVVALGLMRNGREVLAAAAVDRITAAAPGQPPSNFQTDVVLRSTDGGATFGPPIEVAQSQGCVCKPAQRPDGTTFVVAPLVDGSVMVHRSGDAGATWTPFRAARYPGGTADATIAAGPHGSLAIAVYELQGEAARLHVLVSGDDARSWQDIVVGAPFTVADLGPIDDTSPLGPVQGVAATRRGFVVAATVPGAGGAGDIELIGLRRRGARSTPVQER